MAHVSPALRAKRGARKYARSEPVLCLGYQHIYSDVYRCLTRHGTVIHTKQVVWDVEAPLGVWIDETAITPAKIDESELYGAIRLEVFRQPGDAPPVEFGSGNAVLHAAAQHLLRSDGSKHTEKTHTSRSGSSAACGHTGWLCSAQWLHEHHRLRRQKEIVRPEF